MFSYDALPCVSGPISGFQLNLYKMVEFVYFFPLDNNCFTQCNALQEQEEEEKKEEEKREAKSKEMRKQE